MAENSGQEKTEQPTQKRLDDALQKGQVAKSAELNSATILMGGAIGLLMTAGSIIDNFTNYMKYIFLKSGSFQVNYYSIQTIANDTVGLLTRMLLPFALMLISVAIIINVAQVGVNFSFKAIAPKMSKINLFSGIKRMFSAKSLMNMLKGIIKMVIVGVIVFLIIKKQIGDYSTLVNTSTIGVLSFLGTSMFKLFFYSGLFLLLLGVGDLFYQKYDHTKQLKMSKQEVKDENKQAEGNPELKGKIKSKQQSVSRLRMMAAVNDATFVVTNPTHIAVAMKYDIGWAGKAPTILAMGQRKVAERIKLIARENDIPIIENKPLAQVLFKTCSINMEIPNVFYHAVAEVLAQVYKA